MKTYIHHIETLVPPYLYRQEYARDRMMEWLPGKRARRLIRGIYDRSGIETRFSVLPDFGLESDPVMFRTDASGALNEPTTEERNRYFARWSGDMSVEVSRNALDQDHGFDPADITHVITVSCTGFYNPGPDYEIVQGLGLSDSVERYHLGFMGCYAAFPALRMARQFCQARPDAVVLVVCLELCTLHLQLSEEPDSLLANALFADGSAAAIVSARAPAAGRPALELSTFASALAPEGAADMAWAIGNHGFDIRLSTYVPDVIAANVTSIARPPVGGLAVEPGRGRRLGDTSRRARHPGQGGERTGPGARPGSRCPGRAAGLRQHEQCHRALRAAAPARPARRVSGSPDLRHGLRPRLDHRNRPDAEGSVRFARVAQREGAPCGPGGCLTRGG